MFAFVLACASPEALPDSGHSLRGVEINSARSAAPVRETSMDTGAAELGITVGPYVPWVDPGAFTVVARLSDAGRAKLHVSVAEDLANAVSSGWEDARQTSDLTVQFDVTGLAAATRYFYAVVPEGRTLDEVEIRSVATFPDPGVGGSFSFVIVADAQAPLRAPVFRTIGDEAPEFVLQIGDMDHRNPVLFSGINPDAWWQMHRESMATAGHGLDLDRYLLDSTPFFHMWDDHDYGLDDADGTAPYRDVAMRAFEDYFPAPARPAPEESKHYAIRWGNTEIYMLDLRAQRDPNLDADEGGKSMLAGLGGSQKDWLLDRITTTDATWKVIISSSCWNPDAKERDSWSKFATERQEIIDTIDGAGVEGVFVISGDIHSGGGIDDGTHSHFPEMTVPTTNMTGVECTAPSCGEWSEGVTDILQRQGYAKVSIQHFGSLGLDLAQLSTHDIRGGVRQSLTLSR